jgi:GNAT superfamily N-acetyltransferase
MSEAHESSYFAEETLRNGKHLVLRAINSNDKPILQELMKHLSPQSRFFRFFTIKDSLSERDLAQFTEIDFLHHVGLLASILDNGASIPAGTGSYILCADKESAEVSFAVEEEYQGIGIGTVLLKHLTAIARQSQLKTFIAFVLADNEKNA